MREALFADLSPELRRQAFLDQGCKVEGQIINRPFSEDELAKFKDELSEEMIELNLIEAELEKIKDEYKIKMKPKKAKVGELLTDLRLKYRESEEEVFMLTDHVKDEMITYDTNGEFVSSRKLYPQERQTKLINLNQNTGT